MLMFIFNILININIFVSCVCNFYTNIIMYIDNVTFHLNTTIISHIIMIVLILIIHIIILFSPYNET